MKYLVLAVLGLAMAVGLSLWAFNYGGGPHPESVSAGMAKMTLHFTDDKVFVQDLAQVDALLQQRDPHQLALRDTRKTLTELVQARDRAVLAAARQPRPKAFDPAPLLPHLEVLLSTCGREEAALAALEKLAPEMGKDKIIVVNLSGRGDKDIFTVAKALGVEI